MGYMALHPEDITLYILEVSDSNLGPDIGYLLVVFFGSA
jgi:hypothetical protein